jgi:hypothetical protein
VRRPQPTLARELPRELREESVNVGYERPRMSGGEAPGAPTAPLRSLGCPTWPLSDPYGPRHPIDLGVPILPDGAPRGGPEGVGASEMGSTDR